MLAKLVARMRRLYLFFKKVTTEKEALSCVALHMPAVGLRLSAAAAVRKISAVGPKLSAAVWKMSAWEWRREFRPRPGTASSA